MHSAPSSAAPVAGAGAAAAGAACAVAWHVAPSSVALVAGAAAAALAAAWHIVPSSLGVADAAAAAAAVGVALAVGVVLLAALWEVVGTQLLLLQEWEQKQLVLQHRLLLRGLVPLGFLLLPLVVQGDVHAFSSFLLLLLLLPEAVLLSVAVPLLLPLALSPLSPPAVATALAALLLRNPRLHLLRSCPNLPTRPV
jgi:hypothetical protein